MKVQPLIRNGFTQGAKPSYDPSAIPPEALWLTLNVRIDQSGVARIRRGCSSFYSTFGPGSVQGVTSAFGKIMKAWDQNLYLIDPDDGSNSVIGTGVIGATANDPTSFIRWARSGTEINYIFTGAGLYETNGSTTNLVTPYAPQPGESINLLRDTDGSQKQDSGPAKCRFSVLRASLSQRVAAAGDPDSPNSVYLSAPLDATYWPSTQVIQLPDDGGYITGLANWYNALIIFRNKDIWAFFGADATDTSAALVLQDGSTGCIAHRSIAVVPDVGIMFLGPDNVYAMTGVTAVENQVKAIPMADDILQPLLKAISYGAGQANAVYFNREYRLVFPECPEKQRAFAFSTRRVDESFQGWFIDSGPVTSQFVIHEGTLYGAKYNEGKMVRFDDVLLDDGQPIPFELYFRRENLQYGPSRIKELYIYTLAKGRIQEKNLFFVGGSFNESMFGVGDTENVVISTGTDQTLTVKVIADGTSYTVESFTVHSKQLTFADLDKAEPVRIYQHRFRPSLKGNFAQIQITGTVPEQDINILGYGIGYSPRGRVHGIKEGAR